MRISDWSSDVCSSDLAATARAGAAAWHAADTGTTSLHAVEAAEMARLASLVGVPTAGALRFQGSGQITDLGMLADAIGRASCRERVWLYGLLSVVAVSLKKKKTTNMLIVTKNH